MVMAMSGTPSLANKQSHRITRADHTPLHSTVSTIRMLPDLNFNGVRCGEFWATWKLHVSSFVEALTHLQDNVNHLLSQRHAGQYTRQQLRL